MTTLLTVNCLDLYATTQVQDLQRYAQVEQLIAEIDADVIAVQEIIADGPDSARKHAGAAAGLRRLAADVDRRCDIDGTPAVAVGGIIHHTALLWRDGITPLPGSLQTLTRDPAGMWHCAVSAVLDLGGPKIRVGSVQLSPFSQDWGVLDAAQLLRVFNSGTVPGLLGGDFNGVGSDPVYDPDPYQGLPWHPDHVYQLDVHGRVDRRVAHRIESPQLGRMRDCARLAGAPWAATTGHHPADHHPPRRIDRWYATHHLPDDTITGHMVIGADQVGHATDHLPVLIEIDTRTLA